MLMSGEEEQGFIDEISRQKGRFNPTHSEIDKAVKDYLIEGGRIKQITPDDWKDSYEAFVNLPADMGPDTFLMEFN